MVTIPVLLEKMFSSFPAEPTVDQPHGWCSVPFFLLILFIPFLIDVGLFVSVLLLTELLIDFPHIGNDFRNLSLCFRMMLFDDRLILWPVLEMRC